MGLWHTLTRLVRSRLHAGPPADDDYWYQPRYPGVAAGVPVSPEQAQQLTTVSACVKIIAETSATVPLVVYREIPAGKERAPDDPRARLLRRRPNRWQDSLCFREMMTGHAALRGRAYAEMTGRSFEDLQLIPRHPDRVRVLEGDQAGFPTVYAVRDLQSGLERSVHASRMFVLLGPWGGRSPVDVHREAIGLGLAMQEYAARFFGNGSQPGGLLKAPQGVTFNDKQRQEIKDGWENAHRGPQQAHRVAVLEGGLEWQQVGLSAEDSQLFQSRQLGIPEICRIWNVPPYKVQEYGRATWSNTEQMAIDFLTTCMLPWFRRWEEAIRWYLIDEDEPVFAEFLLEGLLRGDTLARYQAYQIATGGKPWMAPNEVRELENRNRLPGLDEVAPVAQGAAPGPQQPGAPMRETPPPDPNEEQAGPPGGVERRSASRLWASWAAAVADALVNAELRALDRVARLEQRDPGAFADWCRDFYLGTHREYVTKRLAEMEAVWRAASPLQAAVAQVVADGAAWGLTAPRDTSARLTQILAVLAEGGPHAVAA